MKNFRIFPLGDHAATIDFGGEISLELNERVLKLAEFLTMNPFPGQIEIVPAYSSLAVFYDASAVRKNNPLFPTAFAAVQNFIEAALPQASEMRTTESRLVKIPVCFDREFALDLDSVAEEGRLAPEEAIKIFTEKTYRVFMLGFLPGFAYMGETDRRLVVARKAAPRLRVPAGSVGLAGRQTGVYSLASPGGWQIIGRTPLQLFTPDAEKITLLQAGDGVEFYAIERDEFGRRAGER